VCSHQTTPSPELKPRLTQHGTLVPGYALELPQLGYESVPTAVEWQSLGQITAFDDA